MKFSFNNSMIDINHTDSIIHNAPINWSNTSLFLTEPPLKITLLKYLAYFFPHARLCTPVYASLIVYDYVPTTRSQNILRNFFYSGKYFKLYFFPFVFTNIVNPKTPSFFDAWDWPYCSQVNTTNTVDYIL